MPPTSTTSPSPHPTHSLIPLCQPAPPPLLLCYSPPAARFPPPRSSRPPWRRPSARPLCDVTWSAPSAMLHRLQDAVLVALLLLDAGGHWPPPAESLARRAAPSPGKAAPSSPWSLVDQLVRARPTPAPPLEPPRAASPASVPPRPRRAAAVGLPCRRPPCELLLPFFPPAPRLALGLARTP